MGISLARIMAPVLREHLYMFLDDPDTCFTCLVWWFMPPCLIRMWCTTFLHCLEGTA